MSIEAMKQALEDYLSREMPAGTIIGDPKWWAEKIARVASQAIAEAEKHEVSQEPVAYVINDEIYWKGDLGSSVAIEKDGIPLYTHPQPNVTTSDMKQEHVDKTAKQRHEENT